MKTAARAITMLCVALASATCTEDHGVVPTEPDIEPQFAKRDASLPAGTLELCKVAGPGIATGVPFVFAIDQSGVMRSASVATGDCLTMTVPREGAPLTKGYFQRKTGDVAELVPPGSALQVDGAALTSDQLVAILQAAPDVQATSSLLLNLTQQLITADLNVVRGVPPNTAVLQAIADANAAVLVDAGPPIAVTSTLDASAMSDLVDVLTAFNEGRPKPPAPAATASFDITETIQPLTEIAAIDCSPASACTGADPAAGTVTAVVTSGETTTATYINRAQTLLRVCKVAGPGIAAGTVYSFSAVGQNVVDQGAADVPAGDCADLALSAGQYRVREVVLPEEAVSDIVCDPTPLCVSADPENARVDATVVHGLTTVTFTNRSTIATVKLCKSAGQGLVDGLPFDFTATGLNTSDSESVTVNTGDCREFDLEEGDYVFAELPSSGTKVTGLGCSPGPLCSSVDIATASVQATVVGGDTTFISYSNSTTFGTLEVCKTAGPGVVPGTLFRFDAVATSGKGVPISLSVSAGDCGQLRLEEGDYDVFELTATNVRVSGIGCTPGHLCGDIDVQNRSLELTIVSSQTTTASFTNRSTIGTLEVCKTAGPGVVPGTLFRFDAVATSGKGVPISLTVAAGDCGQLSLEEGDYDVFELTATGFQVTDIACEPLLFCSNISVPAGSAEVFLLGGVTTLVTYTNAASTSSSPEDRQ
jgi:hypothetical protein